MLHAESFSQKTGKLCLYSGEIIVEGPAKIIELAISEMEETLIGLKVLWGTLLLL
jgi:hypothetical protein